MALGESCCKCFFCTIFSLIITSILFVGSIIISLWLVFRPKAVKVHVEEASLSVFDLNSTSSSKYLYYNLSLDVSIRNPNRWVALYYDQVEAFASYDGSIFGVDEGLPEFFQEHKNTTVIYPSFVGVARVTMSTSIEESTYGREKEKGAFRVKVEIRSELRFKIAGFVKSPEHKPKFTCNLKLPVPSTEKAFDFAVTRCDVALL